MISRLIAILLFMLCITMQNAKAQVIHKNDIESFIGVIKTTPINKPDTWPDDSTFTENHPLSHNFTDYTVNASEREMRKTYPNEMNGNETYSLAMWPSARTVASLNVHEKEFSLIMLHNGGFESSTSFLTLWSHHGDSLQFQHLFSTPFTADLGYVQVEPNYLIDVYNNLVFVLRASGGDAGWLSGYYQFLELDQKNNLHSLLKVDFSIDDGLESHVLYKFLGKKNLLIEKHWFSISSVRQQFNGVNYRLNDRKLIKTELELLDLIELVNNHN